LSTIGDSSPSGKDGNGTSSCSSTPQTQSSPGNNPTADALQELIEVLASDISTAAEESMVSADLSDAPTETEDDTTLPLLLSSLTETTLTAPLRRVIADLLPFLTYGLEQSSKALASQFTSHINFSCLGAFESKSSVLMDTFVDAAISLPPVEVCNSLRSQLLSQGFVAVAVNFLLQDIPSSPPPWSPALFPKDSKNTFEGKDKKDKSEYEQPWRSYFKRPGLQKTFQILIGLCTRHGDTQNAIAQDRKMLCACHWIESTSIRDVGVEGENATGGEVGLLAETLLDALKENNDQVGERIGSLRKATRERKKELAEERRNRALVGMSSFGPMTGISTGAPSSSSLSANRATTAARPPAITTSSAATSGFSSVIGMSLAALTSSSKGRTASNVSSKLSKPSTSVTPSWMAEMEAMEDEEGLTCAVCQEGRTLQPTELLGLYAYAKKVSIPSNKGGTRGNNDGTLLMLSLPTNLPPSLVGTNVDKDFFRPAKIVAKSLQSSLSSMSTLSSSSSSSSSRPSHFVTTVTAGNAIHFCCHARARQADRNHPKAPKSEWEGASLRNSRVACNVILPLVSSKSSEVPLMEVESALADHQTVVSNLLGARPKCMLWTMLHDIRLLLLRICYGEVLNSDCGGGSLSSNTALLFYMFFMADMFAKNAEHDSPGTAQHARCLNSAFIAACEIMKVKDENQQGIINNNALQRGIADAAPMAGICCILFGNIEDEDNESNAGDGAYEDSNDDTMKGVNKRWITYRQHFLNGLIRCAGRRRASGMEDSGCISGRSAAKMARQNALVDWDIVDACDGTDVDSATGTSSKSILGKRAASGIDDHATALRPMITLFAILDKLSELYRMNMGDDKVTESSEQLVATIEACRRAENIQDLMKQANITLEHEIILAELEKAI